MNSELIAAYFDAHADAWDENMPAETDVARITTGVAWMAGIRPGSRVLDLGCGTGVMVPACLAAGAREVVGIDVSSGMIACAREKFADDGRARFMCCDVLEFEDAQGFDVFLVYNAYPHFLDKERLVEKAAALLAPGGRFLVAHGASKETINAHHANVPAEVTSHLDAAGESAEVWAGRFDIDCVVDTPYCYCFGGTLKAQAEA